MCDDLMTQFDKHRAIVYDPVMAAAFALDPKYRRFTMDTTLVDDARDYFKSQVGEQNIQSFMRIVCDFRLRRGIFGQGAFDDSLLSIEDLKNMNSLAPWHTLLICDNRGIVMVAKMAIALLSFDCHSG